MQVDLVDVPIARLITNLEAQIAKSPGDVRLRFHLARVHAMAYAQKTLTDKIARGREIEGAWFGYEPRHFPFTNEKTDDVKKNKLAKEHLARAIELYREVVRRDPNDLTAALGLAWCIEQSGAKQEAIAAYRKVISAAWALEKDARQGRLGGRWITTEAAEYLIPLLDRKTDLNEIALLEERSSQLNRLPRPVTPVIVPLRDGVALERLEDRSAFVAFDADGSGLRRNWSWITPDAGWLVYDPRETGRITSALQFFGSVTFWAFWSDGYEALRALDDDGDGDLKGEELCGLSIWRDANSNGVSEAGEVRPLTWWNITSISCGAMRDVRHPDRIMWVPEGVTFGDGSKRPTYDIVLHPRRQPLF